MFGNMIVFTFVIILAQITSSFGVSKINVTRQCIPTSSAVGPCHECVCTIDGLYHCRWIPCKDRGDTDELSTDVKECEPFHFYREDNTICTCDAVGHWISKTCKNKFQRIKSTTNPNLIKFRTNINCSPNEYYLADCNICKCNPTGLIDFEFCTNRACPKRHKGDSCAPEQTYRSSHEFCFCSDIYFYIDRLCIDIKDEIVQKIDKSEISKLIDVGKKWKNIGDNICKDGNITLIIDCNNCTCNKEGELSCSKTKCGEKTVLKLGDAKENTFFSLPELKNLNDKCTPGVKYRYKCNTCICNNSRHAICASMICVEDIVVNTPFLGEMAVSY